MAFQSLSGDVLFMLRFTKLSVRSHFDNRNLKKWAVVQLRLLLQMTNPCTMKIEGFSLQCCLTNAEDFELWIICISITYYIHFVA